ncbi:MAG: 1-phosphofructokinase family hexose kinase [Candidatus Omnitrophica bacterium]|nr:1-phosphofructokinase family hexose kinase [Candidatus Omnitrophota bacterium]
MDYKKNQNKYILTVTLNPAVDTAITFKKAGNIFRWGNQIQSAGGKGINVARTLNHFGLPHLATGIIGGENGRRIRHLADQEKMRHQFFEVAAESRNNIILFNPKLKEGVRIFPKTPSISRKEFLVFKKLYERLLQNANLVVLSGSVLNGLPSTVYAELTLMANRIKVPVFLDAGQDVLREGLKATPTWVKPNQQEIEELLGIKITNIDEACKAVRRLKSYKIDHIFLSLGAKGAIGCNKNDLWYAKSPLVKVVNSVGCGDTFVAAVCFGFTQKLSFCDCLKLGVAAGSVNATALVPGRINRAQVLKMANRIKLKKLCI